MGLKNSNYIILELEYSDYSIEHINFNNFQEAKNY